MKEFWNLCQFLFTAAGGWLGYFLGGCDGLLLALVLFAVADYITGVMCAVADKKLSSEVGFKGICRKVIIYMLVGIAHIIDVNVIATGSVLRTAVIFCSHFLLPLQRGREPSGERRSPWPADPGEAEDRAGAAA